MSRTDLCDFAVLRVGTFSSLKICNNNALVRHNNEEHIPAHRVVNRNGLLTGRHHFPGENMMQELLESEGIVIIDNQIQNFEEVFWSPIKDS